MDPKLTQYVIDSFSTENSVQKYTNDIASGLWASEKLLVEKYFAQGSTILDLGCGPGRTSLALAEMGYKVTGVDVTPKFIDIAKSKLSTINFAVGDATKLRFADQAFDNILFSFNGWSMIPSAHGRAEAAAEIYRVLKSRGYYIFCVHKRTIIGQELTWLTQLIRLKVLKPLGYPSKEQDFGDFYFNRDTETTYPIPQFVNFMDIKEVKRLHEDLGFQVQLMAMRSELSKSDDQLKSGDVMFFVLRKP
jgi:ubiquinone/menaquinone biosynthesis C-methylase UbiE